MGEIGEHKMLNVVFAVRGHHTAIKFKDDVLVVASCLATYIQGFSETKQGAEADRGCKAWDWRIRFQGWRKGASNNSLRSLSSRRVR